MYSHTNIICKSLVIATFGLFIFPTASALAIEIPAGITAPQSNATTIRGTVTDDTNEPLPGATIVVKGTQNGTSTDIDGNFEINVHRQGKVTLVVSYVGMKTKEVQATSGAKLDIVLETNADMLDEVIVSGFQTISRERNTGSAVVVGAEKLGKIQAPDLSSKLEGVTPRSDHLQQPDEHPRQLVIFNFKHPAPCCRRTACNRHDHRRHQSQHD